MRRFAGAVIALAATFAAQACSSGSGGDDAEGGGAPAGASAAALVSAVDGSDPWSALGELTGRHFGTVERLASDCSFGPDVPFDELAWNPSEFRPIADDYATTFVQRGGELVFELGEGLVFGRVAGSRLTDVVRVGAEGVTHYHDGFEIVPTAKGFDLSGESDWTFYDDHWRPGEVCDGRTSWSLDASGARPGGRETDLHFVLRWPADSEADLDLVVEGPYSSNTGEEDERAFLGEVQRGCFVLHGAGRAGAANDSLPADWIRQLSDTTLPHHEEIVRCAAGTYGTWSVHVANWSGDLSVPFEVEIFSGATLGVDPSRERWIALQQEIAPPHASTSFAFDYQPPPPDDGGGSGIVITTPVIREPAQRPRDPISRSALGFNKAAFLDVPYEELLENVGL